MSSTDYRVSTIVVLCKDCGNDVGLYPGRHKCPPRPAMPSMPSIPSQYQQQPSSSSSSSFAASSSRSANGSNGRMRPADLNPNSLHASGPGSYGTPSPSFSSPSSAYGSRTPTSSSFQDRMGNGSRTPTASSFQDRMKERDREKQLREREEREAAARTIREDSRGDAAGSAVSATATPAGGAGTTLWNRLKAAKEVINATITGEEKWPESDDSDYEGESHVTRVLREHADKKEDEEMAAKIAELDMMPTSGPKATGAGSTSRNQYLRDAVRKEPSTPSIISTTSSNEQEDYYGKSLRARGESTGVRADPTERSWSPASASVSTNNSNNSYGSNNLTVSSATRNRYRTTSDASRDDALSRLEGKSEGDKLAAHVNNLGSTSPRARANSPNTGHRAQDPASSSSTYQQQQSRNQYPQYSNQLSPSSAANPSSYSSSSSQRSVSPGANRRYDPPSPNGSGRYGGGQPQPPVSPSYPNSNNNNYRQQAPPSPSHGDAYGSRGRAGGDPSQGRGRPEYDRRPTYPPQTSGGNGYGGQAPGGGNNLGAYGQRQQLQQQQQQPYQQYQQPYGASQGNYF